MWVMGCYPLGWGGVESNINYLPGHGVVVWDWRRVLQVAGGDLLSAPHSNHRPPSQ